ncbi:MAG: hypothetical protein JWO80_2958 [Bryobacterales bacterium]|nr:hypothetical protein [Bryobacterales bacterium]
MWTSRVDEAQRARFCRRDSSPYRQRDRLSHEQTLRFGSAPSAIPCPVSFKLPCVRIDDGDHRPVAAQSLVQTRATAPAGSSARPSGVTGAFWSRDTTQ